ncbi:tyrosine-type recombinase/integrase [Deinococcus sp. QL22]|uniref:tyrosine-type recombinase/integrase n=1 Tax=Deinococcus sp. QL22 TaxID=2939437 RepID=UPI0020180655|nr:tyrosine-type recombinase/integrase [Deinococcus sp. QL22]UQN09430.1 tyrosine-type recombinase/integrase [Deinococcus sp. QL22]
MARVQKNPLPHVPPHLLAWRHRITVRRHIVRLCELAGIRYEGREVHGLRHTVGTRTYMETGDILEARDLLRHRDISFTQVYVAYARRGKKASCESIRMWEPSG